MLKLVIRDERDKVSIIINDQQEGILGISLKNR